MAEKLTRRVRRTYLDEDSGEQKTLVHEEPVKRRPPKDSRSKEPFAIAFPEGMRQLAMLPLTQTDWAVLMHLVGIMGFEEPFTASPTKIGAALGLDRFAPSRSLRHLRGLGIILDVDRKNIWLHPDFFWRGSLTKRVELLIRLNRAEKNRAADAAKVQRSGAASMFHVKPSTPEE